MKIAIVGSGALGGFYGAMLAHKGYDVHFLFHKDYPAVQKNGLTVKSCNGDFHLDHVNAYDNPDQIGIADLVFVGLKTTSNHLYQQLITPLMGSDSTVLTAQNGLSNEERLVGLFGPDRVAGGLAFLCCNREQPGVIDHLDYGYIHIGNFNRPLDDKMNTFADMLNQSGVKCIAVENLALSRWKKLIWNVPFNGLSALLDQTVDIIMADDNLRRRARQLMLEIQAAARAIGLIIENPFLDKMMDDTIKMKPYATSMQLDRRHHRPMEIESIIGEPLRRGIQHNISMPETQKLYNHLNILAQV